LREIVTAKVSNLNFKDYISWNKDRWNNIIVDQVSQFSYGILAQSINVFSEIVAIIVILITIVIVWGIYPILIYIVLTGCVYFFNKLNKNRISQIGEKKSSAIKNLYTISSDFHSEYFYYKFVSRFKVLFNRFKDSSSSLGKAQSEYIISSINPRYFSEFIMAIFFSALVFLRNSDLISTSGVLFSVLSLYRVIPSFNRILVANNQLNYSYGVISDLFNLFKNNVVLGQYKKASNSQKFLNLSYRNLYFNSNVEIVDFNLNICPNEIILVTGPSGRGKSTLLRLLSGILVTDKAQITLNEKSIENLDYLRSFVYYVDQNSTLSNYTLENNIFKDCVNTELIELLREGLSLDFYFSRLSDLERNNFDFSGGELQRLTIAQAFIQDRSLIFLDEPTSALDSISTMKMINLFSHLVSNYNYSIVIVSHDMSFTRIATRIVEL
jgi:ABC-type transport system involved in cytochrome bd biosynthesis fused ATPase/permease subunit